MPSGVYNIKKRSGKDLLDEIRRWGTTRAYLGKLLGGLSGEQIEEIISQDKTLTEDQSRIIQRLATCTWKPNGKLKYETRFLSGGKDTKAVVGTKVQAPNIIPTAGPPIPTTSHLTRSPIVPSPDASEEPFEATSHGPPRAIIEHRRMENALKESSQIEEALVGMTVEIKEEDGTKNIGILLKIPPTSSPIKFTTQIVIPIQKK